MQWHMIQISRFCKAHPHGHSSPTLPLFIGGVPSWPHWDTTYKTSFVLVCPIV